MAAVARAPKEATVLTAFFFIPKNTLSVGELSSQGSKPPLSTLAYISSKVASLHFSPEVSNSK